MRALKMLNRHDPANGKYGDCIRTALASLLDCDNPSDVPDFFNGQYPAPEAWDHLDAWLQSVYRFGFFYFGASGELTVDDVLTEVSEANPETYFLLLGRSINGGNHCVVCCDGAIVHDPSWAGTGVVGPSIEGHYLIVILIPAKLKK